MSANVRWTDRRTSRGGVADDSGGSGVVVFLMFRKRVNTTWHRTRACANANWMHIKCNAIQCIVMQRRLRRQWMPTNRTSDPVNRNQLWLSIVVKSSHWICRSEIHSKLIPKFIYMHWHTLPPIPTCHFVAEEKNKHSEHIKLQFPWFLLCY